MAAFVTPLRRTYINTVGRFFAEKGSEAENFARGFNLE